MSSKPRAKGRMRRAYLKTFSAGRVSVQQDVNFFKMQDKPAMHYSARARSLGVSEQWLEAWERLWGFPVRTDPAQVSKQRQECEEKLKLLAKFANQFKSVVIKRGATFKVYLHYNEDHTLWFVVEEHYHPLLFKQSYTYGSRERVLQAYISNTVRWYPHFIGGVHDDQGVRLR